MHSKAKRCLISISQTLLIASLTNAIALLGATDYDWTYDGTGAFKYHTTADSYEISACGRNSIFVHKASGEQIELEPSKIYVFKKSEIKWPPQSVHSGTEFSVVADIAAKEAAPSFEVVDVSSLWFSYENNGLRADRIYKGQEITVRGTIDSIGTDLGGQPYVALSGGQGYRIKCVLDARAVDGATELEPGAELLVTGVVRGKGSFVVMTNCSLGDPRLAHIPRSVIRALEKLQPGSTYNEATKALRQKGQREFHGESNMYMLLVYPEYKIVLYFSLSLTQEEEVRLRSIQQARSDDNTNTPEVLEFIDHVMQRSKYVGAYNKYGVLSGSFETESQRNSFEEVVNVLRLDCRF